MGYCNALLAKPSARGDSTDRKHAAVSEHIFQVCELHTATDLIARH